MFSLVFRLYWIDLTILEGDMFRDLEVGKSITDGNISCTILQLLVLLSMIIYFLQ